MFRQHLFTLQNVSKTFVACVSRQHVDSFIGNINPMNNFESFTNYQNTQQS